ncbi:hypothetical protein [Martelella alba]|uniref:hypothetical protein n=1 Tax=Martelella alba TaxID=2590451 RepID=UPI001E63ACE0|nr:hypothetical protein [Martelella alba]
MATALPDGLTWAATLNHVVCYNPLRLIWYSMKQAVHSEHIRRRAAVAGSIFFDNRPELSFLGLDGAQFTGEAREIPYQECQAVHHYYYEHNFTDPAIREKWLIDVDEFHNAGPRRFYELTINAWWLLDLDGWAINKEDRRIAVPLNALSLADDKQ